jgi:hypothetical protein
VLDRPEHLVDSGPLARTFCTCRWTDLTAASTSSTVAARPMAGKRRFHSRQPPTTAAAVRNADPASVTLAENGSRLPSTAFASSPTRPGVISSSTLCCRWRTRRALRSAGSSRPSTGRIGGLGSMTAATTATARLIAQAVSSWLSCAGSVRAR